MYVCVNAIKIFLLITILSRAMRTMLFSLSNMANDDCGYKAYYVIFMLHNITTTGLFKYTEKFITKK